MSRWIELLAGGSFREEIDNSAVCRHMCNEVCCNDESGYCCEYPDLEKDCARCNFFEMEVSDSENEK